MIERGQAAAEIATRHQADDGATFSMYFGDLAGQNLYAVSLYPERGRVIPGRALPPEVIGKFIEDNLDLLRDARNSVGTWFYRAADLSYLDVSATLPDGEAAVALDRQYNQVAIYDLSARREIPTGGTGEERPGLPPVTERLPEQGGRRTRRDKGVKRAEDRERH